MPSISGWFLARKHLNTLQRGVLHLVWWALGTLQRGHGFFGRGRARHESYRLQMRVTACATSAICLRGYENESTTKHNQGQGNRVQRKEQKPRQIQYEWPTRLRSHGAVRRRALYCRTRSRTQALVCFASIYGGRYVGHGTSFFLSQTWEQRIANHGSCRVAMAAGSDRPI